MCIVFHSRKVVHLVMWYLGPQAAPEQSLILY